MSRIKITGKNARIAEEVVVQKDNDLDWGGIGGTIIPVQAKEYLLFPGTDNNIIYTTLEPGDNGPLLIKSDNTIVKLDPNIPKKTIDTIHTLDVLGDNSCIACYTFDNNVNDLSGKYNGTWQGTIEYGPGKFGQAAKFNGNAWIKTNLILKLGITISFWANENGICISALNSSDNGNNFNISRNRFNGGYCDAKIDYSFTNTFYHIVVIIPESGNINDLEFYVNGVKQQTIVTSAKNKIYSNGNNYLIFGKDTFHNVHFKGLIDQVRIFNKALTEDEIVKLYNEQYTKYDISSLNLSNPPIKLFKDFEPPRVLISLEEDKSNFISDMVEHSIPVYDGSTNKALVTVDMLGGENIIVDGKDFTIANNIKLHNVDVSNVLDILGDNSCIACYTFDNNANDLSDKYNGVWKNKDGSVISGEYGPGKFGQAAKFNGGNYILLLNGDNSVFRTLNFTFTFWIKTNKSSSSDTWHGDQRIFGKINPGSKNGDFEIKLDSKGCVMTWADICGDNANHLRSKTSVSDDNWHFCACSLSLDGNSDLIMKIYVDGHLEVTGKYSNCRNMANFEPRLGMAYGERANYFTGSIDQVRIFNKALTEDEVKIIYKEQYTKYDISSLGLLDTPKSVIRKGYLSLIKESSTTSEFIGTSKLNLPLKAGDIIITDQGEVVTTSVNISNNGQINKYTIKYNKLSTAPEFVAIPQKVQEQPYANKKFNGTNFELIYNSIVKQGRAIQRKFIVPDDSIEILPPIKTQLYKVES